MPSGRAARLILAAEGPREAGIRWLLSRWVAHTPSSARPAVVLHLKKRRLPLLKEDEFLRKPEIKLVIPDQLKIQLVDDWEAVTKNNQVRSVHGFSQLANVDSLRSL
jgi:hypothetical protein